MSEILEGQEGILCNVDDVLVLASIQQEHDTRLRTALAKFQAAGLTLNKEKCEFNKERVTFLGHVIDKNDISTDPQKTSAILEMKRPNSRSELRRLMGMANQLSKFSPHIAVDPNLYVNSLAGRSCGCGAQLRVTRSNKS